MRKIFALFLFCTFGLSGLQAIPAQEPPDTVAVNEEEIPQQRELPEIQLKEYTIVGLAKVTLPHKVRTQIFKDVDIHWLSNRSVWEKELPSIAFQFSRVKPSLFRLYEFPWLKTDASYGSYNTANVNINTQFKIQNTLPYFSANFGRSDGHVDNSQWTTAGLQAGVHQKLAKGHLWKLGTDYQFDKRAIWGNWDIFQTEWDAQTTLWKFFTGLDQQWSDNFSSQLNGTYFLDDHENAFQYSDRGWDVSGNLILSIKNTQLEAQVGAQKTDVTVESANLMQLNNDSTFLGYEASLSKAGFFARQKTNQLSIKAGIIYQRGDENSDPTDLNTTEQNFTFPHASVSYGFGGWGNISFGYFPAVEMQRLRDGINGLPFSDYSNFKLNEYDSRWRMGLEINLPKQVQFHLTATASNIQNYWAPILPADSLQANFTQGGYPGWTYDVLTEVSLGEVQARLQWDVVPSLRISGWMNIRQSDISDSKNAAIDGNEVPYLPVWVGQGSAQWNFYGNHRISIGLEYTGERYDNVQNSILVDDYLLVNAKLHLQLRDNIGLFIAGNNLLDTEYEKWRDFIAPGITGSGGIKIEM